MTLKKIWNYLVGAEHSVENIISGITSTVTRLENAAAHHATVAEQHLVNAEAHANLAAVANEESARADALAAKIGSLVQA